MKKDKNSDTTTRNSEGNKKRYVGKVRWNMYNPEQEEKKIVKNERRTKAAFIITAVLALVAIIIIPVIVCCVPMSEWEVREERLEIYTQIKNRYDIEDLVKERVKERMKEMGGQTIELDTYHEYEGIAWDWGIVRVDFLHMTKVKRTRATTRRVATWKTREDLNKNSIIINEFLQQTSGKMLKIEFTQLNEDTNITTLTYKLI